MSRVSPGVLADGSAGPTLTLAEPTAWATGNRIEPAKCQVFEDFGRMGAGVLPDGPMTWLGAKGWTSARQDENGFGQDVSETIGIYRDEVTANAAFEEMASLAKECATYRMPDRTDVRQAQGRLGGREHRSAVDRFERQQPR